MNLETVINDLENLKQQASDNYNLRGNTGQDFAYYGGKQFAYDYAIMELKKLQEIESTKISIEIDLDIVENMITDFIECGYSNYWCALDVNEEETDAVEGEFYSTKIFNILKSGKSITLVDSEDNDFKKELTLQNILKAIPVHFAKSNSSIENYDCADIDCIIQLAIFEEVVYG